MTKRISNIFSALLLAMLFVACSGQKEQSEKGGFGIVGVWQLVQEEWGDGSLYTEGLDRVKIFREDGTFLSLRFPPECDTDIYMAVDGGRFALSDSVYQEYGQQRYANRLIGDSVIQIKFPEKVQVWKRFTGLDESTLQLLKEETKGYKYEDETGHPMMHVVSLAKLRAEAERKYYYAGAAVLAVGILAAVGYALYSRRRRRNVERLLAQFKAEQEWTTEENKRQREANETHFLQTDYYQQLQQRIETGKQMTQRDWDELEAHIALLDPDFKRKLTSLIPLSWQELHVCLLLKAHISPAGIATLTCKSPSAVTSTRSRLYKKVFGKKGGPKEWDEFILSL